MAMYISRKKGGAIATSITPSNTSPVALTADSAVCPTTNGYAIVSYNSVTPSSTATTVSSGDVIKFDGAGVIVDSAPTPATSLTPSNMYPAAITSGNTYTATTDGAAVETVETLAPNNMYPDTITKDHIYAAKFFNGYAISSYSDITPSNSSPVPLSSGSIYKVENNGGYAVNSIIDVSTENHNVSQPGNILRTVDTGYYVWIDGYIRPSSTPEAIASGDLIEFLGAGEVVDSLTSITPSSTATAVSSGDNIHIGGSGVIMTAPTNLTPSNSSPATITSGETYTATTGGMAVESITSITPSNTSPATVSTGSVYTVSTGGMAIVGYATKTPSDSSPASISSGMIVKANSAGYLYASSGLGKCKVGTFTGNTSTTTTVNVGFKPQYLLVQATNSAGTYFNICAYNEAVSDSKVFYGYKTSSGQSANVISLGTTTYNNTITAISSTGFTYNKCSTNYNTTMNYFAIG